MGKEIVLYHKVPLQIISKLKRTKTGTLLSKRAIFNGRKAKFRPHKKEFKVEFEYDIFSKHTKLLEKRVFYTDISIKFGKTVYKLESVFLGTHAPPKLIGSVDRIHTAGFSDKRKFYYQLIIPLERKVEFHFNLEEVFFTTDLGYYSRTGTAATINGDRLQVCCIHNDKNEHYLAIAGAAKQTFDAFSEKAHAVLLGLGYLTGHYAGNQGFYFAYTKRDKKTPKYFRFTALRSSIKNGYDPVYSNAYGYLYNDIIAEKYQPLLRVVTVREFSMLCEKVHDSIDFASALMLILESSVASLLFMPGGYAIALETISDLIIANTKLKLAPIKSKTVSKKIRKEMLEVLNQNSETISEADMETLKIRIDQLNQRTNKARLRSPFDLLHIGLVEEDLKILETRNDFLHGRVPDLTNAGKNRTTERINKDLFYCAIRFYTLLNLIILKWVGYDNRIVNFPKLQESFTGIILDEEPFRQV